MPTAFEKQPLCVFTFSFNVATLHAAAFTKVQLIWHLSSWVCDLCICVEFAS